MGRDQANTAQIVAYRQAPSTLSYVISVMRANVQTMVACYLAGVAIVMALVATCATVPTLEAALDEARGEAIVTLWDTAESAAYGGAKGDPLGAMSAWSALHDACAEEPDWHGSTALSLDGLIAWASDVSLLAKVRLRLAVFDSFGVARTTTSSCGVPHLWHAKHELGDTHAHDDGSMNEVSPGVYVAHRWSWLGQAIYGLVPGDVVFVDGMTVRIVGVAYTHYKGRFVVQDEHPGAICFQTCIDTLDAAGRPQEVKYGYAVDDDVV